MYEPGITRKDIDSVIDRDSCSVPAGHDKVFGDGQSLLRGPPLAIPEEFPVTLGAALQRAACSGKGQVFIDDRGGEQVVGYRDLLQRARQSLAGLQALGARPGQPVILQLDDLQEFLVTFWACVLGGLLPVPVLPFRTADPGDSSFKKLQKIAGQLESPIILMSAKNARAFRRVDTELSFPDCQVGTFVDIGDCSEQAELHPSQPDDLAFLQYTSGSTSFPKGVQISHANVLATIHAMCRSLEIDDTSCLLNWMPYYHDMGIIAGHLMAVVGQCKVVAMKPFTFVRRPLQWLQKIHEHRVDVTFSPNFGFKRVLEKATPAALQGLDLSCLKVILNGAEPISVQTCNRFLELLGKHCRLNVESMVAGYGLAEASLAVTIAPRGDFFRKHILGRDTLGCGSRVEHVGADDIKATWFVDEGPAVAGMELRIVDDGDHLLPVGTVGHVQIRGASVTRGYYANDEANWESFCDDWFRTGDLGFVHEDRFVLTGRVKDVVFVNGQNYYSHDFEHACEHIRGLDRLVVIGHYDPELDEPEIITFVACNKQYTGAREKTDILRQVQIRINQCFDVTPTRFVLLKSAGEIPKTTSGKIIRHQLLENYLDGQFANQCIPLVELLEISPDLSREPDSGKHVTIAEMKLLIRCWWSDVLGISEKAIGDHDPFFTLGGTSVKAMEVLALAEETVDCVISHEMFREYDTIHRLASFIARENLNVRCKLGGLVRPVPAEPAEVSAEPLARAGQVVAANDSAFSLDDDVRADDIAIIGMGCIFPQADNVDAFWQLLKEGRDCISEFPHDRCNIHHYYDDTGTAENRTVSKWGSFIDTHSFDPGFFNLTENEAITMDPHQRVFLTAAWQAIQDSGLVDFEGSRMGVFVGASGTGFYQQREDALLTPGTLTGVLANLAAARVSNAFNLKGPSLSVDTACSSSLVSVDMACKSILNGESDTALAGGVQVLERIFIYLLFSRAGILSPDGKCFTFSERANGFVPGEGAGAVVLKRYRQAIEDGDRVYAVIKSSATNNDGASLGIMSPNPGGQEAVIRAALAQDDIDPRDIGYVEAHGTGTHVGDMIEVRSLSLAFNEKQPVPKQSCAIGSVKTNMGHQLAAAGISGLMKAALSVYHGEIPATLNCEQERKELKLADTPFFVCRQTMPWPEGRKRRLAAVNSFGFGGTNAHVILAGPYHEDVHHELPAQDDEPAIICLSARSEDSLVNTRKALAHFTRRCGPGTRLRDIAYTCGARRAHFRENRLAVVAQSMDDVAALLDGNRVRQATLQVRCNMPRLRRRMAWLFSGQGSQHPGMGRLLFDTEPVFRDTVNCCDEIAQPLLGRSLRELLVASTTQELIDSTALTQPVVFVMDYALAKLWQSWGMQPDFMLGHSIGEYAAACLAGVFTPEDALATVIRRGALMGALPAGGGMTAVLMAEADLRALIDELQLPLDIAACNGPSSTVASGECGALSTLHEKLDDTGTVYRSLQVSHAFHSRHMEPVLPAFREFLDTIQIQDPVMPTVSNVTGKLFHAGECNAEYWVQHVRNPVQFHRGIRNLAAAGAGVYLEVGAQAHLGAQVRRILDPEDALVLSSLPGCRPGADMARHIANTQASLYVNGFDLDWSRYYQAHGERRWQELPPPGSGERRRLSGIGSNRGRMISVPPCVLERRSMFRAVDDRSYPFRHLFRRLGACRYEYVPDPESVLFRDHVVSHAPMLSGAGQCDLVCYLHALSFAHAPKQLYDLSFRQPWLANSRLGVSFSGERAEKTFAVTDQRGKVVFEGRTNTETRCEVPPAVDPGRIRQLLPRSFSQSEVYGKFSECGIEYGAFHRNIVSLHASDREVLATLRSAGERPADWQRGYYIHPGMLDSALQATAGLFLAGREGEHGSLPLMVPVGIGSLCVFRFVQDGEYYSHVTLDESSGAAGDGDLFCCNVTLYDAGGQPCVHINRLQIRRLPVTAKRDAGPLPAATGVKPPVRDAAAAGFFHVTWKERPLPAGCTAAGTRWLLLGARGGGERLLAGALASSGITSLPVPFSHYFEADESALGAILERAGPVDGIVFMGDFDGPETGNDAADLASMRCLHGLLRALSGHARKEKAYRRVTLLRLTRHASAFDGSNGATDIRKACVSGFLRSARMEFPSLDIRQLDTGNTDEGRLMACVAAELALHDSAAGGGPEILYRDGQRHACMVEPLALRPVHERTALFNRDKVFWIIGGTSGVGRLLARHLAGNYRCKLVLSGSRRLPAPAEYDDYLDGHSDALADTIRSIREIEALGATVSYVTADVRSADSIRLALDSIHGLHTGLNGIYFGALQLDDRMILQKDWPAYRNLLDMRVNGLQELVRQTRDEPLDFFVLFSSLAGVTGNIGQSDYSASCAWMDALPQARAGGADCRFISVQWGPWALGQQVSDIVMDHVRRNGFARIEAQQGMRALEDIILGDHSQVAFVPGTLPAAAIAANINQLRLGSGTKARESRATRACNVEETGMKTPDVNTATPVSADRLRLLLDEFGRQRDMLMNLCESQNALLAATLGQADLQLPASPPAASEVRPAGLAAVPLAEVPPSAVEPLVEPPLRTAGPVPAPLAQVTPPAVETPVGPAPVPETPAEPVVESTPGLAKGERPADLFEYVRSLMARAVEMHADDIDPDQNFMELGADSITAMSMVKELETVYDIELPVTLLFEYATLNELVDFLRDETGEP